MPKQFYLDDTEVQISFLALEFLDSDMKLEISTFNGNLYISDTIEQYNLN